MDDCSGRCETSQHAVGCESPPTHQAGEQRLSFLFPYSNKALYKSSQGAIIILHICTAGYTFNCATMLPHLALVMTPILLRDVASQGNLRRKTAGRWQKLAELYSLSGTSLSPPAGFSSPYSSGCRSGTANSWSRGASLRDYAPRSLCKSARKRVYSDG